MSMNNSHRSFTPAEFRKLRALRDPHGIQRFLDDQPYHLADTAWSPRRVLRENTSQHAPRRPCRIGQMIRLVIQESLNAMRVSEGAQFAEFSGSKAPM